MSCLSLALATIAVAVGLAFALYRAEWEEPRQCIMTPTAASYTAVPATDILPPPPAVPCTTGADETSEASCKSLRRDETREALLHFRLLHFEDPLARPPPHTPPHLFRGVPVLFVHGNSGDFHEGRAVGSALYRAAVALEGAAPPSAGNNRESRQKKPRQQCLFTSAEMARLAGSALLHSAVGGGPAGSPGAAVDLWTIDFRGEANIHNGRALLRQALFANYSVAFLVDRFVRSNVQSRPALARDVATHGLWLVGHSMGGITARMVPLLAMDWRRGLRVRGVMTLSTPHRFPPVFMDSVMYRVYRELSVAWRVKGGVAADEAGGDENECGGDDAAPSPSPAAAWEVAEALVLGLPSLSRRRSASAPHAVDVERHVRAAWARHRHLNLSIPLLSIASGFSDFQVQHATTTVSDVVCSGRDVSTLELRGCGLPMTHHSVTWCAQLFDSLGPALAALVLAPDVANLSTVMPLAPTWLRSAPSNGREPGAVGGADGAESSDQVARESARATSSPPAAPSPRRRRCVPVTIAPAPGAEGVGKWRKRGSGRPGKFTVEFEWVVAAYLGAPPAALLNVTLEVVAARNQTQHGDAFSRLGRRRRVLSPNMLIAVPHRTAIDEVFVELHESRDIRAGGGSIARTLALFLLSSDAGAFPRTAAPSDVEGDVVQEEGGSAFLESARACATIDMSASVCEWSLRQEEEEDREEAAVQGDDAAAAAAAAFGSSLPLLFGATAFHASAAIVRRVPFYALFDIRVEGVVAASSTTTTAAAAAAAALPGDDDDNASPPAQSLFPFVFTAPLSLLTSSSSSSAHHLNFQFLFGPYNNGAEVPRSARFSWMPQRHLTRPEEVEENTDFLVLVMTGGDAAATNARVRVQEAPLWAQMAHAIIVAHLAPSFASGATMFVLWKRVLSVFLDPEGPMPRSHSATACASLVHVVASLLARVVPCDSWLQRTVRFAVETIYIVGGARFGSGPPPPVSPSASFLSTAHNCEDPGHPAFATASSRAFAMLPGGVGDAVAFQQLFILTVVILGSAGVGVLLDALLLGFLRLVAALLRCAGKLPNPGFGRLLLAAARRLLHRPPLPQGAKRTGQSDGASVVAADDDDGGQQRQHVWGFAAQRSALLWALCVASGLCNFYRHDSAPLLAGFCIVAAATAKAMQLASLGASSIARTTAASTMRSSSSSSGDCGGNKKVHMNASKDSVRVKEHVASSSTTHDDALAVQRCIIRLQLFSAIAALALHHSSGVFTLRNAVISRTPAPTAAPEQRFALLIVLLSFPVVLANYATVRAITSESLRRSKNLASTPAATVDSTAAGAAGTPTSVCGSMRSRRVVSRTASPGTHLQQRVNDEAGVRSGPSMKQRSQRAELCGSVSTLIGICSAFLLTAIHVTVVARPAELFRATEAVGLVGAAVLIAQLAASRAPPILSSSIPRR